MSMMDKVVEGMKELSQADFIIMTDGKKKIKAYQCEFAMCNDFHPLQEIYVISDLWYSSEEPSWFISILFKHKGKYYELYESG